MGRPKGVKNKPKPVRELPCCMDCHRPVGEILVFGVWMQAVTCPKHATPGRVVLP